MIDRYELSGVTWVDLENPDADEVAELSKEFNIGPFLAEELLSPTAKPRVDVYAESTYAVFHFPALRHTRKKSRAQEIDIILGKKFLITVHYEPLEAITEFKRACDAEELLQKHKGAFHVGHILFELAERLYRESEYELAALEDTVSGIEERIFSGEEKEMVLAISEVTRELLEHKRILGAHSETLETLEKVGVPLFGDDMRNYFHGMASLHYRVLGRAHTMADMIDELRETNMAMLYTRQNEVMKNLTIMAFVTFPLSLIAGIFGMNTVFTPVVNHPQGFWIILGGMFTLTTLFFIYFKIKRWF